MRPLPLVLDAIMNVLNEEKYKDLRQRLKSVKESSLCAAPEAQGLWWNQTAEVLNYELGNLDLCEEINLVGKIFGAQLDYKDYLNI